MIKTITDIEELLTAARTTTTVMFNVTPQGTESMPIKFDFQHINPFSGRNVVLGYKVCLNEIAECDWYPTIVESASGLAAHHFPSDVIRALTYKNAPTLSADNDELLLILNFVNNNRTYNMIGIVLHVARGTQGSNLYFKEFALANRKEAAREFCKIFYEFK